jgi:hypothetical protein
MGRLIAFQLLPYRVEVAVDDERLSSKLRYLSNGARQPLEPRWTMHYTVAGRGPFDVREEGDYLARVGRPDDVLYVLYGRCHARLADYMSLAGWVPLHAGVVTIGHRRVLVIGRKGAGKTTLAVRLLFDGQAAEGDELVFTRGGEAVSLPRNFHLKGDAPDVLPELAPLWAGLSTTSTSDGMLLAAFNPAATGFAWEVRRAPVDIAFALRPNYGASSSVRPTSAVALVADAMANVFPTTVATPDVVRACSLLLRDVEAYVLTVGDVAESASLVVAAATRRARAAS